MQGGCVKMLKITARGFIDSHLIAYKISLDLFLFLRLEIVPSLNIIPFCFGYLTHQHYLVRMKGGNPGVSLHKGDPLQWVVWICSDSGKQLNHLPRGLLTIGVHHHKPLPMQLHMQEWQLALYPLCK